MIQDKNQLRSKRKLSESGRKSVDNKSKRVKIPKVKSEIRGEMTKSKAKTTNCLSECKQYQKPHSGIFRSCSKFNRLGHKAENCYAKSIIKSGRPGKGCFSCGAEGHFKKNCPKQKNEHARGREFEMKSREAHQKPSILTGTFLVNNH